MNSRLYILFLVDKSMTQIMNTIIFQVSLNFDPVKKILKMRCYIYILMKKGIILRNMQHVTMNSFAPPFSLQK